MSPPGPVERWITAQGGRIVLLLMVVLAVLQMWRVWHGGLW